MQQPSMFRRAALEKLSSPERLDTLMRVTDPRGWIALATLGGLVIAAVVWSFFGTLPVTVTGQGMLLTPSGVLQTVALETGEIVAVQVAPGDVISEGQPIAKLRTQGGELHDITASAAGTVLELLVYRGDFVQPGTPVGTVEPANEELHAFVYLSLTSGKRIAKGMPVRIAPETVRAEEYGFMLGEVGQIGEFPSTVPGVTALLNNADVARGFLAHGPVYQVRVDLVRDPQTPSGFKWSSAQGPPARIRAGTFALGTVIVDQQRPLSLLLPAAR